MFAVRVVRHWYKVAGEVVNAPSREAFKARNTSGLRCQRVVTPVSEDMLQVRGFNLEIEMCCAVLTFIEWILSP